MKTVNSIAAVVVTFNRKAELEKTIQHLLSQSETLDIVVIDNDSHDGTNELIQSIKSARIHYLRMSANVGSAGGFSAGMDYCRDKYDWAWLFNDDSRPAKGSLSSLFNAVNTLDDSSLGLIKIGMLKDGKSESSYWRGRRITKFIERSDNAVRTDLITFDGCLINTAVIRDVGSCDPLFFMGIYEFDFCLRALDRGYTIYTLPNGLIEDEKLGSAKGSPYWRMYYVTRNHLYLGLKRRSMVTIFQFVNLETRKVFGILFFQDDKFRKLKFKALAIWHALIRRMGRQVEPVRS